MLAWITATAIVIFRFNPDLLAERLGPRKGAKPWDIAIMSILGLAQLVRYIVAGLDQRYGWTGGFPLAAQIAALYELAVPVLLASWWAERPAFAAHIPKGALIVFLDKSELEFSEWSLARARQHTQIDDQADRPVVYVDVGKLAPRRSRLIRPRIARDPGKYCRQPVAA